MRMTPEHQEHQDAMCDAAETLLDAATSRHYDSTSEETFLECHACGEWDGHTPACWVPALKRWFDAIPPVTR